MIDIKIQLVDTVKGYLDVKPDTNFPINMGIADIRDITKRTGLFSKTITLSGTKNNNALLGSIYDVNLVDGTFNIKKLQKCQVLVDGEIILDNLYIQLLGVNKSSTTVNDEMNIDYEAVLKDTVGDFFTQINQRELTDLDVSDLSYNNGVTRRLNRAEIVQSFTYSAIQGFKYVLPWIDPNRATTAVRNDSNTYNLNEIKPGIFAKVYWDRIFTEAGYTYDWNTLDNDLVRFDKLIIPFNGDEKQMLPAIQDEYGVGLECLSNKVYTVRPSNFVQINNSWGYYDSVVGVTFSEIKDNQNQWNVPTQTFTNALSYGTSNGIEVEFTFDYTLQVINNEAVSIKTSGGALPIAQVDMLVYPAFSIRKDNDTSSGVYSDRIYYGEGINTAAVIKHGDTFAPGTTTLKNETLSLSVNINNFLNGKYLDIFKTGIAYKGLGQNPYITPGYVRTTDNATADMRYKLTLNNMKLKFKPSLNAIDYNFPVIMSGYVPRKIKQTDFISSIAKLYNLYFEPDLYDKTKIIVRTRDTYYDSGDILDWTDKLNKEKESSIQFLPELTSKSIILSYKDDKDVANETYKEATNETYGQIEVQFENEYTKGTERKEIIFSPTPAAITSFGTYKPILNGYNPSSNIRLLLDSGVVTDKLYYIAENGSYLGETTSPVLTHFGGNQEQPDFDINYGICDYYFYNPARVTNNNLYNIHWRRTFSQINTGKLMTALFDLNSTDIRGLKLNAKIRINNSYWNINKVIDFNASVISPTKVELISIDENTKLSPFIERAVKSPTQLDGITLVNSGWTLLSRNSITNNVNLNGYGNSIDPMTTGTITGNNNTVSGQFNSPIIVSGNNNTVASEGVTIFGDNNIIEEQNAFISGNNNTVAIGTENVYILGSNITATYSNTTYTDNIIMASGSTLNGTNINNIVNAATVDILYDDLFISVMAGTLVPYTYYKITDFQTIYDQPDYDISGNAKTPLTLSGPIIPIIVQAISNSELSEEAFGYDGVIKMTYDITENLTEINGSPMKGRINYMLDINRNESYYDHQNILLKRYETALGNGIYTSYKDTGFGSIDLPTFGGNDNKLGSCFNWGDFRISNVVVVGNANILSIDIYNSTITGDGNTLELGNTNILINGSGNEIGKDASDILINSNNNTIGNVSDTIIIGLNSNNNTIGNNTTTITLAANARSNEIGDNCDTIIIGNNSDYNKIGDFSNTITIGTNSDYNEIGDNNFDVTIGNNSVGNKMGVGSSNNTFGNTVRYNTLGNSCDNNTFNDNTNNNTLGNSCDNNTFTGSTCDYNVLGDECNDNTFTSATSVTLNSGVTSRTFNSQDNNYTFQKDFYNVTSRVVVTTNATTTNLYTFTPNGDGVYSFECIITAYEAATGDSMTQKLFTGFKVIGGVVTFLGISPTTDRKSNFPAGVIATVDNLGGVVRLRVTGRAASTISWKGHIIITK